MAFTLKYEDRILCWLASLQKKELGDKSSTGFTCLHYTKYTISYLGLGTRVSLNLWFIQCIQGLFFDILHVDLVFV